MIVVFALVIVFLLLLAIPIDDKCKHCGSRTFAYGWKKIVCEKCGAVQ